MSKHHSNKIASDLAISQRNEAGCRAALIQAQKQLKAQATELETVKFDRNYWRDRAETQEQTIKLLQRKVGLLMGLPSTFTADSTSHNLTARAQL